MTHGPATKVQLVSRGRINAADARLKPGQFFAAAIHSQDTSYKVDFRMDIGAARIEPVQLPTDLQTGLLTLMKQLGLVYGAIDLRRRPYGGHVFLEVNPAGQWLFLERAKGQPIAEALAQRMREEDGQA